MKACHWMVAVAGIALGLPAPASAAVGDPEVIIYRFPGVRDNGNANQGAATVFHCTNFSGVQENIRFVTRNRDAALLSNVSLSIGHLPTLTASTHLTSAYDNEGFLGTGGQPVNQGTTAIAATSINIICTAMTIDASTTGCANSAGSRAAPSQSNIAGRTDAASA